MNSFPVLVKCFFLYKLCVCSLWVSRVLDAVKMVRMAALAMTRNPVLVCWAVATTEEEEYEWGRY